jgi:tetratricopeptide (TPR) repeat protein
MRRMWKASILLAAAVGLYQVGAGASGSSMPAPSAPSGPSVPAMSPEEMARAAYNSGIDHKDRGVKLEQKAAVEQAKDQQKDLAKAKGEFEKSLKDFKRASDLAPNLYQAYNGMGFAYRKTGDYAKALEMYDKALQMQPGFPDAVEYRGEAYLGLNRVEDAKQAYMELFASDRKQADILMKAMTDWVAKRHADPAGVDPAALSAFESWMKERSTLAGQTAHMALAADHESWR